jgi:hypothetical protein
MAPIRKNFHRKTHKRRRDLRAFKATCAHCGKEMILQVCPPEGKRLLCLDCYNR